LAKEFASCFEERAVGKTLTAPFLFTHLSKAENKIF
jgi:hypothetical protein